MVYTFPHKLDVVAPATHTTDISFADQRFGTITVDMSSNPRDLRPARDAVMTRIHEMREAFPSGKIAVIVAESHNMPVFPSFNQLALSSCLEAGFKPAFDIEHPVDIAHKMLKGIYSEAQINSLVEADQSGREIFKAYLLGHLRPDTQLGKKSLHIFCYKNGVCAHFSDASSFEKNGKEYVNLEDDQVLNALNDLRIAIKGTMQCGTDDGLAARNFIRAENIANRYNLQLQNVNDVLVIEAGAKHSFCPSPKYSLSHQLRARGFHVLNVYPDLCYEGTKTTDFILYGSDQSNTIYLKNIDAQGFEEGDNSEQSYVRNIDRESGHEVCVYELQREDYVDIGLNFLNHANKTLDL